MSAPLPELLAADGATGAPPARLRARGRARNLRIWLDANPDDELAPQLRAELSTRPLDYTQYARQLLGWGVFALMRR